MKHIFLFAVSCLLWGYAHSQKVKQNPRLLFNEHKEFKILQFTDIHWDETSQEYERTANVMRQVIQKEKPDIVILTGDVVTADPAEKGWRHLAKIFADAKTPWSVIFGNHDGEPNSKNSNTYKLLQTQPYFLGSPVSVSGNSNCTLPVYGGDGKIKAVIYLLDSHDYTHNPLLGSYDWIKFDQINWYRNESDRYRKLNGNKLLPSVMFFHIPLLEYNFVASDSAAIGYKGEGVASSQINSGMFASLLDKKDVMGVFTGHDHNNNYIGIYKNIALGYGNVTGAQAYGELERGGRVIVLKEGKFSFNSYISTPTAIKFIFNYPSGLGEITDNTKILKAQHVNPVKQGISYQYFEGKIKSTEEINQLAIKQKGIMPTFSITGAKSDDHFAFRYSCWIKIPETAMYRFYTYSDDGSVLKIDGQTIVDNDGGHSAQRKEGIVALEKGFHKLELIYFEDYMGQVLNVGMSSIAMPENPIPADMLFADE